MKLVTYPSLKHQTTIAAAWVRNASVRHVVAIMTKFLKEHPGKRNLTQTSFYLPLRHPARKMTV
jgi:hypothetical protein